MRAFYALNRSSRMRIAWFLFCAWVALCLVPNLGALTIDTFPVGASSLHVGPDGDIWFTTGSPERLMRIRDKELQSVLEFDWSTGIDMITPDGIIWLDRFQHKYSLEAGLSESGIQLPEENYFFRLSGSGIVDAHSRMFVTGIGSTLGPVSFSYFDFYEVGFGLAPELRYNYFGGTLGSILLVSATECWASGWLKGGWAGLCMINLEAGTRESYRDPAGLPSAKDSQGLLWLCDGPSIVTFDGENLSVFAEGDWEGLWYREPVLAADGVVWSVEADDDWAHARTFFGISRFRDGEERTFTTDDGLLTNGSYDPPVIDYDGNVWVTSYDPGWSCLGLSRITDAGWPPMRLMLHRLETPDTIAVEAQVINNGPVVGVDVYVALELNGQLLFWPNWGPVPSPVQVNLCPGFNQSATIIEMPKAHIPAGSYTFWGCMTGRNTQKLIGPLDRKFETLTVEVASNR